MLGFDPASQPKNQSMQRKSDCYVKRYWTQIALRGSSNRVRVQDVLILRKTLPIFYRKEVRKLKHNIFKSTFVMNISLSLTWIQELTTKSGFQLNSHRIRCFCKGYPKQLTFRIGLFI